MKANTILIAEDNEDDVVLISKAFQTPGFQSGVQFVRDGEQAMAYLRGEGPYADRTRFPMPALLLLDLYMPKMDGFQVLAAVRADPVLRSLKVIVLTSSGEPRTAEAVLELGANCCVIKPLTREAQLAVLHWVEDYWMSAEIRPTRVPSAPVKTVSTP